MKSVIKVENLGKKYTIRHKQSAGYKTIQETLMSLPKRLLSKSEDKSEEFWALRNASFELRSGECLGIVGRNGAGKSTLLKLLSRITDPSEGRITINGRIASLLEVGTGFHPELTGRENIFLNGAILGMTQAEIRKKFDEIVDFSEVEKFLDTPVKRYSSGMYVRLAFAVAAHLEPEVLIVDEVLAVGDARFQEKCLGKMSSVSQEGRTVIFVSHNMAALRKLCNRGILIENGRLAEDGEINQVIGSYFDRNDTPSDFKPFKIPSLDLEVQKICINEQHEGVVLPFKPLSIAIEIMANSDASGVGLQVVISKDSIDGVLFYTNTLNTKNINVKIKKGFNRFVCEIDSFDLASGRYMLGFGIDIPNVSWHYYNLHVLNFTAQEVSYGELPSTSRYSHVYLDHQWITESV